MKTQMALLFLCLSLSVSAQKHKKVVKAKLSDFTITQIKSTKKTGTQLFFKQMISDSRCPQDVTCVWAGEAQVNISTYKNGKWSDETILVFSPKTIEENKIWISKQMSIPIEKIKSVVLFPYPKGGQKINPKSYVINVAINK